MSKYDIRGRYRSKYDIIGRNKFKYDIMVNVVPNTIS
jgi:hypothetical protein